MLELFRAGDASLLSSAWENFPHTVVEALAVGTPVIATRTGGVAEVLSDGVNGLVVEPGDARRARRRDRALLRARTASPSALRAAAAPSVADYAPDRVYGRLEQILDLGRADDSEGAVRRPRRASGCRSTRASRASGTRSPSDSTCASSRAAPAAIPASRSGAPSPLDGPRFYASLPGADRARAAHASGRTS